MSPYKAFSNKSLHLILPKSGEWGGASTMATQVRQRSLGMSVASPSSSSAGKSRSRTWPQGSWFQIPAPPAGLQSPPASSLVLNGNSSELPSAQHPRPSHLVPSFIVSQSTFFCCSVFPVFKGVCVSCCLFEGSYTTLVSSRSPAPRTGPRTQ